MPWDCARNRIAGEWSLWARASQLCPQRLREAPGILGGNTGKGRHPTCSRSFCCRARAHLPARPWSSALEEAPEQTDFFFFFLNNGAFFPGESCHSSLSSLRGSCPQLSLGLQLFPTPCQSSFPELSHKSDPSLFLKDEKVTFLFLLPLSPFLYSSSCTLSPWAPSLCKIRIISYPGKLQF